MMDSLQVIITYCECCPVSCSWIYVVSVDVQSGMLDKMKRTRAHILVIRKKKKKKKKIIRLKMPIFLKWCATGIKASCRPAFAW